MRSSHWGQAAPSPTRPAVHPGVSPPRALPLPAAPRKKAAGPDLGQGGEARPGGDGGRRLPTQSHRWGSTTSCSGAGGEAPSAARGGEGKGKRRGCRCARRAGGPLSAALPASAVVPSPWRRGAPGGQTLPGPPSPQAQPGPARSGPVRGRWTRYLRAPSRLRNPHGQEEKPFPGSASSPPPAEVWRSERFDGSARSRTRGSGRERRGTVGRRRNLISLTQTAPSSRGGGLLL